jgi:hypothetical protein
MDRRSGRIPISFQYTTHQWLEEQNDADSPPQWGQQSESYQQLSLMQLPAGRGLTGASARVG